MINTRRVYSSSIPASVFCPTCEETGLDVAHVVCMRCGDMKHPSQRAPHLCSPCYRRLRAAGRRPIASHNQPKES
jgi:hypothetical protein